MRTPFQNLFTYSRYPASPIISLYITAVHHYYAPPFFRRHCGDESKCSIERTNFILKTLLAFVNWSHPNALWGL